MCLIVHGLMDASTDTVWVHMARTRRMLAEANLYDDKILGLNSYAMKILAHYSRANSRPSAICTEKGRG